MIVCALGCASAIWPPVEHAVNRGLLGLGAAALLVAAVRRVHRSVRERHQDRSDTLAGRAWWAEHQPRRSVTPALAETAGRST